MAPSLSQSLALPPLAATGSCSAGEQQLGFFVIRLTRHNTVTLRYGAVFTADHASLSTCYIWISSTPRSFWPVTHAQ